MYLWLIVIMFDINYLSNKILLKQGWKACTKQLRVQCGSITLSKSFRPCLICLWTGFQGTGYIYMHKACGTLGSALRSKRACAEDPVSTLHTFQAETITSVSCSHFPVAGWVLIDGWCALVVHWGALTHLASSEGYPIWVLSDSSTVRTMVLWAGTIRRLGSQALGSCSWFKLKHKCRCSPPCQMLDQIA